MKRFVNGQAVELSDEGVEIRDGGDRLFVKTPDGVFTAVAVQQGDKVLVSYKGGQFVVERKIPRAKQGATVGGEMRAPMPGLIVDVMASEGENVKKGQKILVLEAMKTQQPFASPFEGILKKLLVAKGAQVVEGALLAVVEEQE